MSSHTSPNSTKVVESPPLIESWGARWREDNDRTLREAFRTVLEESAQLPPEERLIMYDACDEGEAARAPLGTMRKRLDSRRNTKPKKAANQLQVCTPFDPNGFHFGKIKNARERLLALQLGGGTYHILTNKFPLFPSHMLLVTTEPLPQQMTAPHLRAVLELVGGCASFCAYFNSWRASASVNHFHSHLIAEIPPVALLPLEAHPAPPAAARGRCFFPQGFNGHCYVLPAATPEAAALLAEMVAAMQAINQPHNLLFTPTHVYLWPKPADGPPAESFELYPETVGGPELLGSFTVYTRDDYDRLSPADATALTALNTAPLPAHLLGSPASAERAARPLASSPEMMPEIAPEAEIAPEIAPEVCWKWAAPTAAMMSRGLPIAKSASLPEDLLRRLLQPKAPGWEGRRRDAGSGM